DPLSWLVILGGALLIGGGAAAVVIKWNDIKIAWYGKRLVVLGVEASGQAHLIKFLTEGKGPDKYQATQAAVKTKSAIHELKHLNLTLYLKGSTDVPGMASAADQWKDAMANAHILLYLARADHLLNDEPYTTDRLRRDTRLISRWLEAGSNIKHCFLILSW